MDGLTVTEIANLTGAARKVVESAAARGEFGDPIGEQLSRNGRTVPTYDPDRAEAWDPPVRGDTAPGGKTAPAARKGSLEKRLTETFTGWGMLVYAFDQYDGQVLCSAAPEMAKAWDALAAQNATVKKILDRLTQGGAWGGVFFATLPPALAILLHHGWLRPSAGMLSAMTNFGGPPTSNGHQGSPAGVAA